MGVQEQLQSETKKWLERIKAERPKLVLVDQGKADLVGNIDAYIADSEHFAIRRDFVRAFEAVVWAWSWLEIGQRLGFWKIE